MSLPTINLWSDIDNELSLAMNGDINIARNVDAVIQSLENILGTSKGERVMRPLFGSGIDKILFENPSEATGRRLSQQISMAVAQEPRVDLESLEIEVDIDRALYTINLVVKLKELNLLVPMVRILRHTI